MLVKTGGAGKENLEAVSLWNGKKVQKCVLIVEV